MDAAGAELVRRRIEQQEHWLQADSVREGRQPRVDPDRDTLEEIGDGVRLYGLTIRHDLIGGLHEVVTGRVCKRLVGGTWERELIVQQVERVA
jgi:hypothetical protein